MHIAFYAKEVSYSEAIGGEIVQVEFEQEETDGIHDRTIPYILISVGYEFPPFTPSIEWHNGNDYDGGSSVTKYKFGKNSFQLWLENGVSFDIEFNTDETTFKNIASFFKRTFNGPSNIVH